MAVTGKDKEAYKKRYGELWRTGGETYGKTGFRVTIQGVDELIKTEEYRSMNDVERAAAIKEIVTAAKAGATYEIGKKLGYTPKNAKDDIPEVFAADKGEPYMERALALWDETGKDAALPHLNTEFSADGVAYKVAEEDKETWAAVYRQAYVKSVLKDSGKWDALSAEEKLAIMERAHERGHSAAKKWYVKLHRVQ